jgi:hypothetical protein
MVARVVGFILLGATVTSCIPAGTIAVLGTLQALPLSGGEPRPLDRWPPSVRQALLPTWVVSVVVVVLAGYAGRQLARTDRRLVLFLRRFRHAEASHVVTVAANRIGGSWRTVTLDDKRIVPVGANRKRGCGAMS